MSLLTFIRIFLFIFIDIIFILFFAPLGLILLCILPHDYSNENSKNVVILIHGTSTSKWQWKLAQFYLRLHGISYKTLKYNHQQRINKSIEDIKNNFFTENDSINSNHYIVGHSQGGLIALHLHSFLNSRGTFLLNSPTQGSNLVAWLMDPESTHSKESSHTDMRAGSEFIQQLDLLTKSEEFDKNIYEIVGLNDFVRPHESIKFNNDVYRSWFSHYSSAVNPWLWNTYIIKKILN